MLIIGTAAIVGYISLDVNHFDIVFVGCKNLNGIVLVSASAWFGWMVVSDV